MSLGMREVPQAKVRVCTALGVVRVVDDKLHVLETMRDDALDTQRW